MHRPLVERSAELELDTAGALRAVTDPRVLSLWLGRWDGDAGDGTAAVTTDDGVRREVTDLEVGPAGVRWRWAPLDRPDDRTDVSIDIERIDDHRTMVTVRELAPGAPARATARAEAASRPALDPIKWSVCLLVLQIAGSRSRVAV